MCDVAEDWLEEAKGSERFDDTCVALWTDRLDSRSRDVDATLDGPGIGSPLECPVGSKLRRGLVRNPLLFVLTVSWLSAWSSSLSSWETHIRVDRNERITAELVEFCDAVGSSWL